MAFLSVKGDIPQPSLAVASQMQRQRYDIRTPVLLPEVAARCRYSTFFQNILHSQE